MMRDGLGALTLAFGLGACFRGEGTLGSICRDDSDCGAEQSCMNEVCGACGDGISQRGELCLQAAADLDSAPLASVGELLAVDLNLDGHLDLLTRGMDGRPQWWAGDGEGGWTVGGSIDGVGARGALRLAELDEDDAIDLVVVDDDVPALHLGYADGALGWNFGAPLELPAALVDLAVGSARIEGPAWVAWVDAGGLWHAVIDAQTGALMAELRLDERPALGLGDAASLDGDGILDLPVIDIDAMQLEAWLGDGAGGLVRGESIALSARPVDIVVVDVDGDGDVDLLVPDEEGGVTVIVSDGQGTLVVTERPTVGGLVRGATVADLNRDGVRDLVVLATHEDPLWVFIGRGNLHPDAIALDVAAEVGSVIAIDGERDGLVELLLGPRTGAARLQRVEAAP